MPTVGPDGIPRYLDGTPVTPPEPCATCHGTRWVRVELGTVQEGRDAITSFKLTDCPACTQPPEPSPQADPCHCAEAQDDTLYLDNGRTWTPEEVRAACPEHGGQPAPQQGPASEPVEPKFLEMAKRVFHESYQYGCRKYGTPLYTFNGRKGDWQEEWASLGRYVTQLELEKTKMEWALLDASDSEREEMVTELRRIRSRDVL